MNMLCWTFPYANNCFLCISNPIFLYGLCNTELLTNFFFSQVIALHYAEWPVKMDSKKMPKVVQSVNVLQVNMYTQFKEIYK